MALALALTGSAIAILFERHVQRKLADDLDVHLTQIEGALERGPDGALRLTRQPLDPRFAAPLSGLYWQAGAGERQLRSRSLWDERLAPAGPPPDPGETRTSRVAGPAGQTLMLSERAMSFGASPQTEVRVAVAADLARLDELRDDFTEEMAIALTLLWAAMMAGAFVHIRLGLQPLQNLTAQVAALRAGRSRRIEASGPREVEPLVDELNIMLAARDAATEQARRRAADLAHGLKTPLAALTGDAERLDRGGEHRIAADIARTAEEMRRHVERHLVRARLVAPDGKQLSNVTDVARGLLGTLRRTPAGERLSLEAAGPDLEVPVPREDLMDCLGNLLENAVRFARSNVKVSWSAAPDWSIVVADDGPGIPENQRAALLERGARLDERGQGAGLGLAIVSDIASAHGLALELAEGEQGGLRAVLKPMVTG